MAKLGEAVREAAALALKSDAEFGEGCAAIVAKIKKGISEFRKAPERLNDDVPTDANAWEFLLRVASEKPCFVKQVWDAASVLIESETWAAALRPVERKERLNVTKSSSRDALMVSNLLVRLLANGVIAELGEVLPDGVVVETDASLCSALIAALAGVPTDVSESVLSSTLGSALAERAAYEGGAENAEKRKVIGGGGQKSFGKNDDIPVFTCEGIHGSHQKMDIKRGV